MTLIVGNFSEVNYSRAIALTALVPSAVEARSPLTHPYSIHYLSPVFYYHCSRLRNLILPPDTTLPYTHISHSTDYAIVSIFSRSRAAESFRFTRGLKNSGITRASYPARFCFLFFFSFFFSLFFFLFSAESLAQTVEICDSVSHRRN
ncbi:hypothetical protein PUN28_005772 [Cardiocondyla obscurior]|uniref:Uncharacterized protein n=1 Tax=Cardiocondyla obscurior TaxID=286306 RepID=A0AAW2GAF6_9HYME